MPPVARFAALALLLAATPALADWRDKVEPWVFDQLTLDASGESEFLIVLAEHAVTARSRLVYFVNQDRWPRRRLP